MTVIINGLTVKKVVEYVEMIHIPQIKVKLLKKCLTEVLKKTEKKFDEVKSEPELHYAKWNEVEKLANIHKLGEIEAQRESML